MSFDAEDRRIVVEMMELVVQLLHDSFDVKEILYPDPRKKQLKELIEQFRKGER